jgi:hypothetical protein
MKIEEKSRKKITISLFTAGQISINLPIQIQWSTPLNLVIFSVIILYVGVPVWGFLFISQGGV